MDVKYINPFIESFTKVMTQMGFGNVQIGKLSVKAREIYGSGVLVVLGIMGDITGNVVYMIDSEDAKKIASTLLMGTPVDKLDDMAKSALSELTNMLTANAATAFFYIGTIINISTPTMLLGENLSVTMNSVPVLCIQLLADNIPIEINISFEKIKKF